MPLTNDLSNLAAEANALVNSITANSTAITAISVAGQVINSSGFAVNATFSNTFTVGTAAYFVSNGNVGIGTNSPGAKLHVLGGTANDAGPEIRVAGSGGFLDIHNNLSTGSYNSIVAEGDKALIFTSGAQNTGSLVIGPWFAGSSGIRITNTALTVAGSILPSADNTFDLGSASLRWANVFTGDLNLSNEGSLGNDIDGTTGKWTIQEGEDSLFIINKKNGKKYKFVLEEIE